MRYDLSLLSVREQVEEFERIVLKNSKVGEILETASSLDLPGWYLTAGCLFQTVWNVMSGRHPESGIRDYDLFYFDDSDLSWEAEDEVIRNSAEVFPTIDVEIRNEARVHLWYEKKFGVPCEPFGCTEEAINAFAATTCCFGIRAYGSGLKVYAPHGFSDLFGFVLRPNPVLAPAHVYESKAARWSKEWPRLRVLDWPGIE